MKRKKECQPNPFTCESHIFTNSTFKLDVMPLDTLIGSWIFFLNDVKKGQFKDSIRFKLVPKIFACCVIFNTLWNCKLVA